MKKIITFSFLLILILTGCTAQDAPQESMYFGNIYSNGVLLTSGNNSGVPYVGANQSVSLGTFGLTATGITDSSLTNVNAVVLAGAGGALTSTPNLVYQAGYLSSNAVKVAAITTGQVVVAGIGTQGTLSGSTNMSFDVNTGILSANLILPNATLSSSVNQTAIGMLYTNNVTFNSNDQLVGITHSTSSNTSQIWIQQSGAYLITFSAVIVASAPSKHADFWFRKNGTDVANSNTHYELPISGESLATVTIIFQLLAGEYIELIWASADDANMKLFATNAAITPTRPASPSIILTINKVSS